ncbi:MAG: hypothetical protein K0U21_08660 [Proteobacteria bacterium]|nr:hypothetical protein [Pseudomonadota bacterium]
MSLTDFIISGVISSINFHKDGGATLMLKTKDVDDTSFSSRSPISSYFSPNIRVILTRRAAKKIGKRQFLAAGNSVWVRGNVYGRKVMVSGRPFYMSEIRAEQIEPGSFKYNRFNITGNVIDVDVRKSGNVMVFVKTNKTSERPFAQSDGISKFYTPIVPVLINRETIGSVIDADKTKTYADLVKSKIPAKSAIFLSGYLTSTRRSLGNNDLFQIELHSNFFDQMEFRSPLEEEEKNGVE